MKGTRHTAGLRGAMLIDVHQRLAVSACKASSLIGNALFHLTSFAAQLPFPSQPRAGWMPSAHTHDTAHTLRVKASG